MDMLVYVGTYSLRGSEGIYCFGMDGGSGRLELIGSTPAGKNPSYLAVDPGRRFLFAVNEVETLDGAPGGGVRSYALERPTGRLGFLSSRGSGGAGPCHLTTDGTGCCLLVAHFVSGSVAILPIDPDGRLGEVTTVMQHPMPPIARRGQDAPHAHTARVDPTNTWVFVPDYGLDRIMVYALEAAEARLRPHPVPWVALHPGAGPRHFVFHPKGGSAYVINELDNTICAYRCADGGVLEYVQRISALPEGWKGTSYCADVCLSPDGRYLYGSNRGHDSIVVFAVNSRSGTLTLLGHEPTRGAWPRGFTVDPTGRFLLVANQNSDGIVVFRIDPESGRLDPTGQTVAIPAPSCLVALSIS